MRLQLIQNSACRTILWLPKDTSIKHMHQELQILMLKDRKTYHMYVECHKNIYGIDSSLKFMFVRESDQRERRTRNSDALSMVVPLFRTFVGRKAFSYRGPHSWNTLDRPTSMMDSINVFKSHLLKEFMRDVNHLG